MAQVKLTLMVAHFLFRFHPLDLARSRLLPDHARSASSAGAHGPLDLAPQAIAPPVDLLSHSVSALNPFGLWFDSIQQRDPTPN
jgi:hypothetical protein